MGVEYLNVLFVIIILISLIFSIKRLENFSNFKGKYEFFYRKCPSKIPYIQELSFGWVIESVECLSPCPSCPESEKKFFRKILKAVSSDKGSVAIKRNLTKLKILLSKTIRMTYRILNRTFVYTYKIYKTVEKYIDPVAKKRAQFYGIADDEVPIYGIESLKNKLVMKFPVHSLNDFRYTKK